MAGPDPAISRGIVLNETAGSSPAMTNHHTAMTHQRRAAGILPASGQPPVRRVTLP